MSAEGEWAAAEKDAWAEQVSSWWVQGKNVFLCLLTVQEFQAKNA